MPVIELKGIRSTILKGIDLTIEDGELLALVGPNGAGKTTILNVIAGLIDYEGEVYIDGRNMDRVPAHRRGVGYLFQDLALFPHMSVASNISYGLRVQHYPERVIKKRTSELMEALNISNLKDRYPDSLSGGERQRVAIARAIAPFQKILLLDEPFASLDQQTSKHIRIELRLLVKRLGITSVLVIHDLLGAEEMADRIAIIHNGIFEQVSSPGEVFFHPRTEVVSEFIGMPNILDCTEWHTLSPGLVEVISNDMRIILPYEGNSIKKIAISPHDIFISDTKPPGPALNRYKGVITELLQINSMVRVKVRVGKNTLLTEVHKNALDEMQLKTGKEVYVIIKLRRLRYFEA